MIRARLGTLLRRGGSPRAANPSARFHVLRHLGDALDQVRKLFENRRARLKGQRLKPHKERAEMIERHRHGIAAYRGPRNKASPGLVAGLSNKVRAVQRRAHGLHDEEYLKLTSR